jgi:hypothetical protein
MIGYSVRARLSFANALALCSETRITPSAFHRSELPKSLWHGFVGLPAVMASDWNVGCAS